jgi:pectate lyase
MRQNSLCAAAILSLFMSACATSAVQTETGSGGSNGSGGDGSGGTQGSGGDSGTTGSGGSGTTGSGGSATTGSGGSGTGSGGSGSGGSGSGGSGSGGSGATGSGGATGTGGAAGTSATGTGGKGGGAGTGAAGAGGKGGGAGSGAAGIGAGGTTGKGGTGGTGTGGTGTGGTTTGTGGTTTGTGGSTSSCTTPPAASALVGWASVSGDGITTTTGGGSATPQTVTSVSAFNSAAGGTNAAVIYVSGKLPNGSLKVGSNKTIVGLCGAELHGHVDIVGSNNVIVRNIKIVGYAVGNCALDPSYDSSVGCSSGDDAITVEKGNHIWFDHDDISDGTDGNLDITLAADYVTVSWTKFHYTSRTDNSGSDSTGGAGHRYSDLVGGSDNSSGDVGKLNVTWHHDWWADNVVERQPRVRYGKNHLFNNLWTSSVANYCIRAGMDAQILVENSAFVGVKSPQAFNSTADQGTSYITSNGNLYSGTSGTQSTGGGGTAFKTPPYTYTMDAASGVQSAVQAGAGPQ